MAVHEERWEDRYVTGLVRHTVLRCRGCETVYVQRAESCSEDDHHYQDEDGEWQVSYPETKTYWPAPSARKEPDWVHALSSDRTIASLHKELYGALNAGLPVLAAIGIRTVFDRAAELLGIEPSQRFATKLDSLLGKGLIGTNERDTLEVLTDAGGAAAHRGWRPGPNELELLMSILETFLYRTLVLGGALEVLKAAVPPKAKSKVLIAGSAVPDPAVAT